VVNFFIQRCLSVTDRPVLFATVCRFAPAAADQQGWRRMNIQSQSTLAILATLMTPAIAQALISRYGNLTEMAKAQVEELQTIPGIGPRKAQQLQSAFELAQLLSREVALEQPVMDTPERVAALFREEAKVTNNEAFYAILLNTRFRLIKIAPISHGTLNSVAVDGRAVFRLAVAVNAFAVTLVHFHPSGSSTPSDADIRITRELIRAGQVLHIQVLDHLILGRATASNPKDFCSLREAGYFLD